MRGNKAKVDVRKAVAADKRRMALELRKAGASYQQISDQLGLGGKSNAHRAVKRAILDIPMDAAREVLASVAQAPAPGWAHFSPLETATLTDFTRLYNRHLREEDGLVYPAARAGLSPEALQAMSADMMRRRGLEPG